MVAGRPISRVKRITVTTSLNEEVITEFKKIAQKEGTPLNHLLENLLEQYNHTHGDGNPAYTLDNFKHERMVAMPAFMSDKKRWTKYLQYECNEKEREEFRQQLLLVDEVYTDIRETIRKMPPEKKKWDQWVD